MLLRFSCFFMLMLSTILTVNGQSQNPFSRLDVFELEWATNPEISPDGRSIVYERRGMDIMKDRKQSRLWLMDADGNNHQKLTAQDLNEYSAQWSPDGTRIAFTSSTEHGAEIFVYWTKTGKIARLTQLPRSPGNLSWSPDGKQLAFSMLVPQKEPSLVSPPPKPKGAEWADHPKLITRLKHEADGAGYLEPGFTHLFIIAAEGGTARQITNGDFNYGGPYIWTKDGKSILFSGNLKEDADYDYTNSEIYSIAIVDGKSTALTSRNGPDEGAALSPDGKTIAYVGYEDKVQTYQINRLYIMNVDGTNKKEINTGLDRSLSDLKWAADGSGLYFVYDDKGDSKIAYTTLAGKTTLVANGLGGTSIGRPYGGGSYSKSAKDEIVYTFTTAYHPAELAMVTKGGTSKKISTLNEDLLSYRNLGKVEEIWYKSTIDQLDIQGWIVTPPNFDPSKKYPLLVENHGGPISNYGLRFSPEMQLFAAAGYVVFYPNPRGSTGYGEKFGNLLYHDYPNNDYQDVMDGVDVILKKGYCTEDSLFVTGGSAGGTMTAWMIGKNNRFRAAAVVKPVMNWFSKTLTADNYYQYANYRYPGQPWENMETYMKYSPVSLVGNIQTPTLVMVGTADLRTPLSEAKQLYHALKIRKIETALVEIPGASHSIASRPSQLITKVDHILAWFAKFR